jgi:hypothetical protein
MINWRPQIEPLKADDLGGRMLMQRGIRLKRPVRESVSEGHKITILTCYRRSSKIIKAKRVEFVGELMIATWRLHRRGVSKRKWVAAYEPANHISTRNGEFLVRHRLVGVIVSDAYVDDDDDDDSRSPAS